MITRKERVARAEVSFYSGLMGFIIGVVFMKLHWLDWLWIPFK